MSAPTCPEKSALRRLLGGDLRPEETATLEDHLTSCSDCRADLQRLCETTERPGPETTRAAGAETTTMGELGRVFVPTEQTRPDVPGYVIERELGRGGMGVVYLARQVEANRRVAIKLVAPASAERPDDLLRFRLEGESLARLHHPNVVQIYEVGSVGGRPFFSMEYVPGGPLSACLHGPMRPAAAVAEMAEAFARAVHAAHQRGIVHRDLKPANILLTGEPWASGAWPGAPKVADFGLAKQIESDSGLTRTGQIMGTPNYMAPEQARGEDTSVSADIYALGAILYEMLSGRPPFQAGNTWETLRQTVNDPPVPPSKVRPGVPADLETIALKCLSKAPPDRYASADALAEDLRRYREGRPISAKPVGAWRRGAMWCRRHPVPASLSAALIGALVVGAVGVLYGLIQAREGLAAVRRAETRAVHNASLARGAVEDYLTRVSENRLIREPGLQELRKELPSAALAYYRDFARERRDDPAARFDLAERI